MRIFLIGFMGSGKTHWGTRIGEKLSIPFFDLDTVIVNEQGRSISELFATKGEEYFRYQEKKALEELTAKQDQFIISTGGGTPCFFNNIKFMKKNGKVVWLNTSTEVLKQRLLRERVTRPLLKNISESELRAFIIRKLTERKMYYEQAHIVVPEDNILLDPFIELLHA
jgi:shikimate kinase